jgi:DNA-directed RNA polymerase subunit RPC12/RpoP
MSDSSNNHQLLYKFEEHNWGEKTSFEWSTRKWNIYNDLSVEFTEEYDELESTIDPSTYPISYKITKEELNRIGSDIDLTKLMNYPPRNGTDGVAWEFTQYDNNRVIWTRELGYIYGIQPLEDIVEVLSNLKRIEGNKMIDLFEDKVDINLEDDEPIAFDFKKSNNDDNNICPYCGSTKLRKYLYNNVSEDYDREKYILGGSIVTGVDPIYRCNDCGNDIYIENGQVLPDDKDKDNETIKIELKKEDSDYILVFNHYLQDDKFDFAFVNMNRLGDSNIEDFAIQISSEEYNYFESRLSDIISNWENIFIGLDKTIWSIDKDTNDKKRFISGYGAFPGRWNEFIDLLIEYEMKAKKKDVSEESSDLEEKYLKEIEKDVDEEMLRLGLVTEKDGKLIPTLGSCHTRWAIEKRLLKERYDYDWMTPDEKHPDILYD